MIICFRKHYENKVLNITWWYDYVNIFRYVNEVRLFFKINIFVENVWNNYENMFVNIVGRIVVKMNIVGGICYEIIKINMYFGKHYENMFVNMIWLKLIICC